MGASLGQHCSRNMVEAWCWLHSASEEFGILEFACSWVEVWKSKVASCRVHEQYLYHWVWMAQPVMASLGLACIVDRQ